jgi:hypothetical protein
MSKLFPIQEIRTVREIPAKWTVPFSGQVVDGVLRISRDNKCELEIFKVLFEADSVIPIGGRTKYTIDKISGVDNKGTCYTINECYNSLPNIANFPNVDIKLESNLLYISDNLEHESEFIDELVFSCIELYNTTSTNSFYKLLQEFNDNIHHLERILGNIFSVIEHDNYTIEFFDWSTSVYETDKMNILMTIGVRVLLKKNMNYLNIKKYILKYLISFINFSVGFHPYYTDIIMRGNSTTTIKSYNKDGYKKISALDVSLPVFRLNTYSISSLYSNWIELYDKYRGPIDVLYNSQNSKTLSFVIVGSLTTNIEQLLDRNEVINDEISKFLKRISESDVITEYDKGIIRNRISDKSKEKIDDCIIRCFAQYSVLNKFNDLNYEKIVRDIRDLRNRFAHGSYKGNIDILSDFKGYMILKQLLQVLYHILIMKKLHINDNDIDYIVQNSPNLRKLEFVESYYADKAI